MSNYTQYFDDLYGQTTGWGALHSVTNTYEAVVGAALFWVLLVTMPFIAIWIKQQSAAIPLISALVVGGVLLVKLPPEFDLPIKMLLVLGVAGVIWHMFMKRG